MTKEKTDVAVMKLLSQVRQKKEQIKNARKRPLWKTNCILGKGEDERIINIQTITDIHKIVTLYAKILFEEKLFSEAASELGVEQEYLYRNFSGTDWKEDLKTRLEMLQLEKRKEELAELDKRVNKLVSPEQRREMELKELQKLLAE